MGTMSQVLGPAAMAALLAAPAFAQPAAPAGTPPARAAADAAALADNPAPDEPDAVAVPAAPAADGTAPADPHLVLPALTGGPDGSPTALRGNPLPGTSTSIPTANPAGVPPLPERQGQAAEREDTGIEGQCDPVVSLGCPDLPAAGAAAQPANPTPGPAEGAGATGGGATN